MPPYVGWHAGDGVVKTLRATGEVDARREGRAVRSVRCATACIPRHVRDANGGCTYDDGFTGTVSGRPTKTDSPSARSATWCGSSSTSMRCSARRPRRRRSRRRFSAPKGRRRRVRRRPAHVARSASRSTCRRPRDRRVPARGDRSRRKVRRLVRRSGLHASRRKRFLSAWHHGKSKTRFAYSRSTPNAPIDARRAAPAQADGDVDVRRRRRRRSSTPTRGVRASYVDLVVNGVKGQVHPRHGRGRHRSGRLVSPGAPAPSGSGTTAIGGIGGANKANLFHVDAIAVGGSTLHDVVVSSGLDEQDLRAYGRRRSHRLRSARRHDRRAQPRREDAELMDPTKVEPAPATPASSCTSTCRTATSARRCASTTSTT